MWSTEKKNRLKLCYFWALLLSFQFAIEIQKLKEETKDDMNEWISDTDEWCNWSNKFNDGLLTQYTVHVLTHYNWKKNTTLSYSILYTIQGIPTISMRKSQIRKIISSSIWREGRRCRLVEWLLEHWEWRMGSIDIHNMPNERMNSFSFQLSSSWRLLLLLLHLGQRIEELKKKEKKG